MRKKKERVWAIKIGDHVGKDECLNYFALSEFVYPHQFGKERPQHRSDLFHKRKDAVAMKKSWGNHKYIKIVELKEI